MVAENTKILTAEQEAQNGVIGSRRYRARTAVQMRHKTLAVYCAVLP